MNISTVEIKVPSAIGVAVSERTLSFELNDGRTLAVPVGWYPGPTHATRKERDNWKIIGSGQGIHWEDIDEDISVEGLLQGKPSGESQSSLRKWLKNRDRKSQP